MSGEALKTLVRFSSERFPFSPEETDDNGPEYWNDALATFLYDGLRAHGIDAQEPFAEDWGYCIEIPHDNFELFVGCAPQAPGAFTVFVHPKEPEVTKWFRKYSTVEAVKPVIAALEAMLAEPGITDVTWELG